MTQACFRNCFQHLAGLFPVGNRKADDYFVELEGLTDEQIKTATRIAITRCDHFPSVHEWRQCAPPSEPATPAGTLPPENAPIKAMGSHEAEVYVLLTDAWRESFIHASETGRLLDPDTGHLVAEFAAGPSAQAFWTTAASVARMHRDQAQTVLDRGGST